MRVKTFVSGIIAGMFIKNDPMWNPVALDEAIRIRIAGCQAAK